MSNKIKKLLREVDYSAYDNDAGAPFWGDVGAGVLVFCKSTQRFLLDHRSEYVNEPNTFGVFGGKVDEQDQESLDQTVRREFEEETGYDGSMKIIPLYVFRTGGFEYHNYLGIIASEFDPENSWESQGHIWVTWEELMDLPNKHFGLEALIDRDGTKIKKLIQNF